jgi:hypothetical protein
MTRTPADLAVGANGQHQANLARIAIGRHGFKNQRDRLAGQAGPIECRDVAQAQFGCRGQGDGVIEQRVVVGITRQYLVDQFHFFFGGRGFDSRLGPQIGPESRAVKMMTKTKVCRPCVLPCPSRKIRGRCS